MFLLLLMDVQGISVVKEHIRSSVHKNLHPYLRDEEYVKVLGTSHSLLAIAASGSLKPLNEPSVKWNIQQTTLMTNSPL